MAPKIPICYGMHFSAILNNYNNYGLPQWGSAMAKVPNPNPTNPKPMTFAMADPHCRTGTITTAWQWVTSLFGLVFRWDQTSDQDRT